MAKVIKNFNLDLSDMAASGGNRAFSIEGDIGAIFSLEITNEDSPPKYYNFTTGLFSTTRSRLKQQAIGNSGRYNGTINFPSITDNDQYDIYLWVEPAYDTIHSDYKEVRFGDGSLDINSSTGSNSSLVQKVIYQYTDTTITIYPWMQTLGGAAVTWIDTYVADTIVVGRGKNSGKQSFSMTVTTGATEGIRILRQPTESDFFKEVRVDWEPSHASNQGALTGGGFVQIQGEDPWAEAASRSSNEVDGHTRGSTTWNGGFSGVTKVIVAGLPSNTQVGDRVTGNLETATETEGLSLNGHAHNPGVGIVTIVTINPDTDNANEITLSEAITAVNGQAVYFNAPYYYRYKTVTNVNSAGVLGIKNGMIESGALSESNPLAPPSDGGNRPATLGSYEDSTTYTTETINDNGSITEQTNKTVNISYPTVDITGFKPTIVNGKVTEQHGVLTFKSQQKIDVAVPGLEGNTWFVARGLEYTKIIHNTEIKVSNLKVELTKPITYTTGVVSDSTTIAVADREGTIANISTISGIGVGISNTDTVDGAVATATKIVMDNNVAGHMKVGDIVTGVGIPNSSNVTVAALNPDGDNVKEFSVSESVTIADGITLTFKPQSLPVVTSSTADGAGSWTVDVAQTLESGAILTVENTGRTATITGDIEITSCGDTNFNLILEVPNFITGV